MKGKAVTKISVSYNVALITLENVPNNLRSISDIFNAIACKDINVDMISQSPCLKDVFNVSFTIGSDDLLEAISVLNSFKTNFPQLSVQVDANNTKISVYGEHMNEFHGVAAGLFSLLSDNEIEIKLVTTSDVDISCLLYEKDVDKAIQSIKKAYQI